MIGVGFLGVGSADEWVICDIVVAFFGNVALAYETDHVGAFNMVAYSIGQASKLIGRRYGSVFMISRVT
jgi:hypothetical protein